MNKPFKKFFLYRSKFIRLGQKNLFDDGASASKILQEAIEEKPSVRLSRGGLWRVANINKIGTHGGRFAIGRISKTNTEKFDEESSNFVEGVDNIGPFAIVYFDLNLGVIAIEDKSKVNSDVGITAKRIEDLFRSTKAVMSREIFSVIEEISDPETFISKVMGAKSVTRFKSAFRGPNPVDADKLFQKPLEIYAEKINASAGEVVVVGDNLDKQVVIGVARSAAATGNRVSATVIINSKRKTIHFAKGAKSIDVDLNASETEVFNEMLDAYKEIRLNAGNAN